MPQPGAGSPGALPSARRQGRAARRWLLAPTLAAAGCGWAAGAAACPRPPRARGACLAGPAGLAAARGTGAAARLGRAVGTRGGRALRRSTCEALDRELPFPTNASLLREDVVYEGPLQEIRGRGAYIECMRFWRRSLPERLEAFNVTTAEAWSLRPGEVTGRWSCSFLAPLPPTARLRGLPPGLVVLPGERVPVETQLRVVLELDSEGRVARHSEKIAAGFGMPDAIARYELLTARRRDADPVSWYWRVLRETTLEELDFYAGGRADRSELEWRFNEMVLRNYGYGLALGALLLLLVKAKTGG
mmetsp:Transcript_7479/g.23249  ORF Transcript_7479/g.23249 Transcript_7479/m.23249 type:complete len:304 (+) Transcript_7479:3-914(+)